MIGKLFFVAMIVFGVGFAVNLCGFFLETTDGISLMRSGFLFVASVIFWKLFSK